MKLAEKVYHLCDIYSAWLEEMLKDFHTLGRSSSKDGTKLYMEGVHSCIQVSFTDKIKLLSIGSGIYSVHVHFWRMLMQIFDGYN